MPKGVGRKISRGGGLWKKYRKIAKKNPKNSTIEPLPEVGATEKRPKNRKNTKKKGFFNLSLLYWYHV